MKITSINTRGQNVFIGTDADKSFVIKGSSLSPIMPGMEIHEVDNTVRLGDGVTVYTVNFYDNAYHLELPYADPTTDE